MSKKSHYRDGVYFLEISKGIPSEWCDLSTDGGHQNSGKVFRGEFTWSIFFLKTSYVKRLQIISDSQ
jgi:hypothetical protein